MSFELKPCFCLFCFKELDDGIEIEKDPHTKEIIIKYFWFDVIYLKISDPINVLSMNFFF